jgi:hypothetical protein
MANKKSTTGRDEERVESERKAEREGFGDTSGPEVSGSPALPAGRNPSIEGPGEGADVAGEAASAKPEDQGRIVAEQMTPLDSDEVGTPLAGPGAAMRAREEEAEAAKQGEERPPEDLQPPPASEALHESAATDTVPAGPPPGGEATRSADPWVTGAGTVAAAGAARPEGAYPADDGTAPPDAAEPETAPVRETGTGIGDDGRLGGRDDGHDGAAGRPNDEPADEGGRSLASTLLAALLLLIAGAAIGIWGAPRLAPHLPSGMAPVAEWLSPRDAGLENRVAALAADTEAAVTELRAEVDHLAAEVAEPDDTAALDARLAELETRVDDRIAAMSDELAALDGAETRDRLSRLEAAVEGQQETLASLRDQFAQVEVGETAAQIDAYEAELAGLRGEIRDVAGQVGALSRRIDEVAADAQRQVEVARARVEEVEAEAVASLTRAEIEADLAQIRSALAAGAPYEEPVERLATRTEIGVPEGLAAPAAEGVPTLASLRQAFPDAATSAIRAEVQAGADDDFLGRLRGFAEAQVATRSLEPRPGEDADAILSRMEAALRQDDLETALAEAEALPPAAADAMAGWLETAHTRHAAIRGYEQVQADLSAMN